MLLCMMFIVINAKMYFLIETFNLQESSAVIVRGTDLICNLRQLPLICFVDIGLDI